MTDIPGVRPDAPTGLSRRTLVAGAAWAAPVVIALAAIPAVAASGETIPISEIGLQQYGMNNQGSAQDPGPLHWSGGQIGWYSSPSGMSTGTVTYTVILTKPDGSTVTLLSSAAALSLYDHVDIPAIEWGTAPLPTGTYKVTLTVTGAGGSKTAPDASVTV